MKISCAGIIGLFLTSFFIGFIVFALPISLISPITENTTARLLCQPGTFRVTRRVSDDGNHYTNYKCINQKGVPQDITFQALAVPGSIATGGIFILWLAISLIRGLVAPQSSVPTPSPSVRSFAVPPVAPAVQPAATSGSRSQRLKELKDMYDANLINAEDYERKKQEILDQV
jgi:putative oligomerization/nucleic acid binding protein